MLMEAVGKGIPGHLRGMAALALAGNQRGAGLGSAVVSLAKRALTSDLARDAALPLGAMAMQRVFGEKKQRKKRRRPAAGSTALALPPAARQKKRRKRVGQQRGGLLPLAALPIAALTAKTISLGALGGAAGFGAQKLLGLGG